MKKLVINTLIISILFALFFVACEPLDIKKIPILKTGKAIDVTYSSATVSGLIIDAPGDVMEIGHCYSQDPNPTINDIKIQTQNGFNPGESIYTQIDDLVQGYTYYVRAYAITKDNQEYYGDEISFQPGPFPDDWGITVIEPQDGEFWPLGKSKTITWQSYNIDTFVVGIYDTQIKQMFYDVGKVSSVEGQYTYTINFTLPNDGKLTVGYDYVVRVMGVKYDQYYDFKRFRATNPVINQISEPNSGSKWNRNREYSIKWTSNDVDVVDIDLYQGTNFIADIADGQPVNGGTYPWDIPITVEPGTGYNIKISYTDYPEISETSEAFEILDVADITVTYPENGSTVSNGTSVNITWTDNIEEDVKIELCNSGYPTITITNKTASNGSYTWNVSNIPTATGYTIKIISVEDQSIYGESGTFTVN